MSLNLLCHTEVPSYTPCRYDTMLTLKYLEDHLLHPAPISHSVDVLQIRKLSQPQGGDEETHPHHILSERESQN